MCGLEAVAPVLFGLTLLAGWDMGEGLHKQAKALTDGQIKRVLAVSVGATGITAEDEDVLGCPTESTFQAAMAAVQSEDAESAKRVADTAGCIRLPPETRFTVVSLSSSFPTACLRPDGQSDCYWTWAPGRGLRLGRGAVPKVLNQRPRK
jgi:hypothetical protein